MLFLAVSLLVPLEAAAACLMDGYDPERCPERHDARGSLDEAEDCMDVTWLPEPRLDGVPSFKADFPLGEIDDTELPPALPPREVLPDPPAAAVSGLDPYSTPSAWLQGTDTYLLTLRLRL